MVQNWRADVIGLASSQGGLVDHVRYSPYGVPTRVNPVDIADNVGNPLSSSSSANDSVNEGDYNYFMNEFLSNGAGADIASAAGEIFPGGDGAVNEGDYILFFNEYFVTYARGQLTADGVANRLGYAGYEFDPVLIGSGSGAAASDPTCFYLGRMGIYLVDVRFKPSHSISSYKWDRTSQMLGGIESIDPYSSSDSIKRQLPYWDTAAPSVAAQGYQNCVTIGMDGWSWLSYYAGTTREDFKKKVESSCWEQWYSRPIEVCHRTIANGSDKIENAGTTAINIIQAGESHCYLRPSCLGNVMGLGLNGVERAGGLPSPESRGNPRNCYQCSLRMDMSIQLPYGIGAGVFAPLATPEELWSCISNHRATSNYDLLNYNCFDWAREAAWACGLSCPAGRGISGLAGARPGHLPGFPVK